MSPFFEPSNYCVDFVYMKKAQQKTTLFCPHNYYGNTAQMTF